MRGALRMFACYALVVSILGGLWTYAVLRERISRGENLILPPADPALLRHVREIADEEDRKEQQQRAAANQDAGAVTQVENGR